MRRLGNWPEATKAESANNSALRASFPWENLMRPRHFGAVAILIILYSGLGIAQGTNPTANRIQLKLNSDEAAAVLGILAKKAAGQVVSEDDWQHLFATEPYIRLKKREASMKRDFTDDEFKKFVLSPELAAKAASLRHTLDEWMKADLNASAARVLSYLPEQATIRANVFPMIKPKTNSFVFDTDTDPAICAEFLLGRHQPKIQGRRCGQCKSFGVLWRARSLVYRRI
jgi:hypothetical protein